MSERVEVVASGTISRDDTCAVCGGAMMCRVDPQERVEFSFCGDSRCPSFLAQIQEAK